MLTLEQVHNEQLSSTDLQSCPVMLLLYDSIIVRNKFGLAMFMTISVFSDIMEWKGHSILRLDWQDFARGAGITLNTKHMQSTMISKLLDALSCYTISFFRYSGTAGNSLKLSNWSNKGQR